MRERKTQSKGEWAHQSFGPLYCPRKACRQRLIDENGRVHACRDFKVLLQDLMPPFLVPDGPFSSHAHCRSHGVFGLLYCYISDRAFHLSPDPKGSSIDIACIRRHDGEHVPHPYPIVIGNQLIHFCSDGDIARIDIMPVFRTFMVTKSVLFQKKITDGLAHSLGKDLTVPNLRITVRQPEKPRNHHGANERVPSGIGTFRSPIPPGRTRPTGRNPMEPTDAEMDQLLFAPDVSRESSESILDSILNAPDSPM